jgi:signal transduction histidine kinase
MRLGRLGRGSIRVRLTLSHLVVIALAMSLAGFLLFSFLNQYFLQAVEESLIAQAQIAAQALIPSAMTLGPALTEGAAPAAAYNAVQQQNVSNLRVETQNVAPPGDRFPPGEMDLGYLADASLAFSTQLETRIRLLDLQGVVLVDSAGTEQGADLSGDPLVAQALVARYASRSDSGVREGQAAMYVALPVTVDGRLVGVVYLSQPLRDVRAVLGDLRVRWILSTAAALLLSGAVGLLLSRAIARPVRRLTDAAAAVSQGDLDQQVPIATEDELGGLSSTFNEMTARLRAARQMQVDFVANVSHELRTPLTTLKGMTETLRDGAIEDEAVRDRFLGTIEAETDRLIRLVNDLLTLSRADSGALHLTRAPVNIAALAEGLAARFAEQANEKGLLIEVQASSSCPLAWGDRDRIGQVLINLLDNAVKYSPAGGTIAVRVACPAEDQVRVEVRDEGVGIAPQELGRIGERFYRTDRARSREEGGSGLGLAIARALVRAHDGELWVESEVGQGTTVSFVLPAA